MWYDQGLRPERAAEIIVVLKARSAGSQGSGRRGSGYLLSPGKVLTAAHVVEGAGSVQVRFQADRPDERMVSAEVAWQHPGIDVAILSVPVTPGDTKDASRPSRSARSVSGMPCCAAPRWASRASSSVRTRRVHTSGTRSTCTRPARSSPTVARAPSI
ncbi:trypsin-like peptidase domain-containing protein [Streptomyces sp. NBC_01187]|uniref:trypsin-like peptidase domain-containing protein n=1 Tax=Streptomyces sp. NBC_01187 TaxID=2903766 RepID=UPI00386DF04C